MAKNLKTLLKIFTAQRHDIHRAFSNILYSLNNEVSSKENLLLNPKLKVHHNPDMPINALKEADDLRRLIVGNDSLGLNEYELRILQEMALSWGSLEQSIIAIKLFLRHYKIPISKTERENPEERIKTLINNIGFYIVDIRQNKRLVETKYASENSPSEKLYPADNDLHIFLSEEFYKDREGTKRRTITPNLVNKIAEYVPAAVDTIYYKHLTEDVLVNEIIEVTKLIRMYTTGEVGGMGVDGGIGLIKLDRGIVANAEIGFFRATPSGSPHSALIHRHFTTNWIEEDITIRASGFSVNFDLKYEKIEAREHTVTAVLLHYDQNGQPVENDFELGEAWLGVNNVLAILSDDIPTNSLTGILNMAAQAELPKDHLIPANHRIGMVMYHTQNLKNILIIRTVQELQDFATRTTNGEQFLNQTILLQNDLDLTGVDWIPISSLPNGNFRGIFDGMGYTIRNLTLNKPTQNNLGVFGFTGVDSMIKNLSVENVSIVGNDILGGLVGQCFGRVLNCSVKNVTIRGNNRVGGLMGFGYSRTNRCFTENVDIVGNREVGGFAGLFSAVSSVSHLRTIQCTVNSGTVQGVQDRIGGFCGAINQDTQSQSVEVIYCISRCVVNNPTNLQTHLIGGFCGSLIGANRPWTLSRCLYDSTITGVIDDIVTSNNNGTIFTSNKGIPQKTTELQNPNNSNFEYWNDEGWGMDWQWVFGQIPTFQTKLVDEFIFANLSLTLLTGNQRENTWIEFNAVGLSNTERTLSAWNQYVAFSKKFNYWYFENGGWINNARNSWKNHQEIGFRPTKFSFHFNNNVKIWTIKNWSRETISPNNQRYNELNTIREYLTEMGIEDVISAYRKVSVAETPAHIGFYDWVRNQNAERKINGTLLLLNTLYEETNPQNVFYRLTLMDLIDTYKKNNDEFVRNRPWKWVMLEGNIENNFVKTEITSFSPGINSILYKILERKGCSYAKN